jgi:hypothetical protein
MAATFVTNPVSLETLLGKAKSGALQLPDFQRSWVWDEERIRSLIASVSRGFPVGALMTLAAGSETKFKARPVEGAAASEEPESLLLDGQQRITSLFQVTVRGEVVHTITAKNKPVQRWFYIDMERAMDPTVDRESTIISVPADKKIKSDFGRRIDIDLSDAAGEFKHRMFPLSRMFSFSDWRTQFVQHVIAREGDVSEAFTYATRFEDEIVKPFSQYQVPVIELGKDTTKEAVCVVFEKVNTGGKALDAFELITAMYAADGYELRKDWYGSPDREGLAADFAGYNQLPNAHEGILANVDSTDLLHVISLYHTRDRRRAALDAGKSPKESPQIIGNRAALLNLPLDAYKQYLGTAVEGFHRAAKFLYTLRVFRTYDLPYQSQVIPLAAILGEHPEILDKASHRDRLAQWYWNGVFGELYGSSTETRIARDFQEVAGWILGSGPRPSTIEEATFSADRLWTMRMRLSAAYKGVNALLMKRNARDFRTGQEYIDTVFFEENVDIHHIFPQAWCKQQGIERSVYDSVVNKTALTARTNRVIGGDAPSRYLARIEDELDDAGPSDNSALDDILGTHMIDAGRLRADDFEGFMQQRHEALLRLIEEATGQRVFRDVREDDEAGESLEGVETTLTLPV